jgi:membrane-bound lytic murein transglycosylase A
MEEGMPYHFGRSARLILALAVLGLILPACSKKKPLNYSQELAPGQMALRKIPPAEYPDFSAGTWNLNVLVRSIDASLLYMSKPSSQRYYPYLDITHQRAQATLLALRQIASEAAGQADPGRYLDEQVRAKFEVYKSIGAPSPGGNGYTDIVLFTGYCTPNRDASPVRTGPYQWPLYKRPADLATDPDTGEAIGRRLADGSVVPYYTRAEIEGQNVLAGHEFVWLKNRWEAYVITIQGSGRLRMPDGRIREIGFAGHNGHDYSSPGLQMVKDGVIRREELNLRTLERHFTQNPAAADKYLWLNQRTVFFTDRPGGPYGKLNVPITTMASIATDKDVYPRAMPAFLQVPIPRTDNPRQSWPFSGFMLDQDAGGAIRAAGRCDIFMGIGDEAENLAGHQLHEGALYYIAVKPELVENYPAGR